MILFLQMRFCKEQMKLCMNISGNIKRSTQNSLKNKALVVIIGNIDVQRGISLKEDVNNFCEKINRSA